MLKHIGYVFSGDLPVGPAADDDIVLSGLVDLDHRMAAGPVQGLHIARIGSGLLQHVQKKLSIPSHGSGMVDLRACPGQGHRLVQSFAAAEFLIIQGLDRFFGLDKTLYRIRFVNV